MLWSPLVSAMLTSVTRHCRIQVIRAKRMRRATVYSISSSQVVLVYLHPFRCNLLLNAAESCKKITKTPYFGGSRSFKVINVKPLKSSSAVIVTVSSRSMSICKRWTSQQR